MTYVEGFVCAVPTANKEVYRAHAAEAASVLREHGLRRMVEAWGDDVPDGNVTDFRRSVKAEATETTVFAWFEYGARGQRDAANERIRSDPRMRELGARMPFDGKRMIHGGFTAILDTGPGGAVGYLDGFVLAVPTPNKEAYRALATDAAETFIERGATRVVEAWGDDVPDGKLTDFRRAVLAKDEETVVFAWVEWPSKAVREAGWKHFREDQPMDPSAMPFDGKRVIHGGFVPILDQ